MDSQTFPCSPASSVLPHSPSVPPPPPIHSSHSPSQSSSHSFSQSPSHPSFPSPIPTSHHLPLRKSTRVSHAPTYLKNYVCYFVQHPASLPSEPQYYQQATPHPAWQEAMEKEFQALDTNSTWDIVLHLERRSSPVNGCTKSNKKLMVPLKGISPD